MRRGGSGEMTRAMPYNRSRMKIKNRVGGECVNQDERRRLRRLMGDGLWTRLGKKKKQGTNNSQEIKVV